MNVSERMSELERLWEIGESVGESTPDYRKVYEKIVVELSAKTSFDISRGLAAMASNWVRTKDLYYTDEIIILMLDNKITDSPTLNEQVKHAIQLRREGRARADSYRSRATEEAKQQALFVIANLISVGASLAVACRKAVVWHADTYPGLKPFRASTIEKCYVNEWRCKIKSPHFISVYKFLDPVSGKIKKTKIYRTREQKIRMRWALYRTAEDKELWKDILKKIPEPDNFQIGRRR
ncbi:hypothetical protein [Methylobacterium sp. Gmos1]